MTFFIIHTLEDKDQLTFLNFGSKHLCIVSQHSFANACTIPTFHTVQTKGSFVALIGDRIKYFADNKDLYKAIYSKNN